MECSEARVIIDGSSSGVEQQTRVALDRHMRDCVNCRNYFNLASDISKTLVTKQAAARPSSMDDLDRSLLEYVLDEGAEAIEFMPDKRSVKVSLLYDNARRLFMMFPSAMYQRLLEYYRDQTGIDAAKNRWQASFRRNIKGESRRFSISLAPTQYGESILVRLGE